MRFAVCLNQVIAANKQKAKEKKAKGIEDLKLISSLRKLTANSTVDFATIQKIASGRKNPAWSTVVMIVEGLNMTMEEWGRRYDAVTEKDIMAFKKLPTIGNFGIGNQEVGIRRLLNC